MKKRNLTSLRLNKKQISNLTSAKGGNGASGVVGCQATISRNFIDICCGVYGTANECLGSQNRHCGGGGGSDIVDPDTNTTAPSNQLHCGNTVAGDCSMECYASDGPAC